jgi:hypothetical protein
MTRIRVALLGLAACLALVASTDPAFADCAGGGGGRKGGTPRSDASPLGVGLAGVALAWGLMWAGLRFAGKTNRK